MEIVLKLSKKTTISANAFNSCIPCKCLVNIWIAAEIISTQWKRKKEMQLLCVFAQSRALRGMCLPALLWRNSSLRWAGQQVSLLLSWARERLVSLRTAGCGDQSGMKGAGLPPSLAGATAGPREESTGSQNSGPGAPKTGQWFCETTRIQDTCEGCDVFLKQFWKSTYRFKKLLRL